MGVSKNNGTPKSSILIGFSLIFTIHFGGKIPLFLVQHPYLEVQTPHQVVFWMSRDTPQHPPSSSPLQACTNFSGKRAGECATTWAIFTKPPGKNTKVGQGRWWQTRGEVSLMSCLKKLGSRSRVIIKQDGWCYQDLEISWAYNPERLRWPCLFAHNSYNIPRQVRHKNSKNWRKQKGLHETGSCTWRIIPVRK